MAAVNGMYMFVSSKWEIIKDSCCWRRAMVLAAAGRVLSGFNQCQCQAEQRVRKRRRMSITSMRRPMDIHFTPHFSGGFIFLSADSELRLGVCRASCVMLRLYKAVQT